MKTPFWPIRLTIRRLMVAVAVVALLIGWGIEGERRRARFESTAIINYMNWNLKQEHVDKMNKNYDEATVYLGESIGSRKSRATLLEEHRQFRRRVFAKYDYYKMMTMKYRFAASYPWLPVTSDPIEPQ